MLVITYIFLVMKFEYMAFHMVDVLSGIPFLSVTKDMTISCEA